MNLGILGLLLAQVIFTWEAPPADNNVTKVEIHVTTQKGNYTSPVVFNAGLPPVLNGKQSYTATVDVSSPKWAVIRGQNSFGLSAPSAEIYLGKPQALMGLVAAPAGQ